MNPCETKLSEDLSALRAEFKSFKELMAERHDRYQERDLSNKERVSAAFAASEKAGEKTESALKEYKTGANEWRDTVKDLISMQQGGSKGMEKLWGWITAAIMFLIVIWSNLK